MRSPRPSPCLPTLEIFWHLATLLLGVTRVDISDMVLAMMSLDHVSTPKVPGSEQGKYRSGCLEGRQTHGWSTTHTTETFQQERSLDAG